VICGISCLPAARPVTSAPAARNHSQHRLAVGRLRPRELWAESSSPATSAGELTGVALTPAQGTIPPELGRHASTAIVPAAWKRGGRWCHQSLRIGDGIDHGPALLESARPGSCNRFRGAPEGWVGEESRRQGAGIRGECSAPENRWPAAKRLRPARSRTSPNHHVVADWATKLLRCGASSPHRRSIPTPGNQRPRPEWRAPWRRARPISAHLASIGHHGERRMALRDKSGPAARCC